MIWVFKRSATNFQEFFRARKTTVMWRGNQ